MYIVLLVLGLFLHMFLFYVLQLAPHRLFSTIRTFLASSVPRQSSHLYDLRPQTHPLCCTYWKGI